MEPTQLPVTRQRRTTEGSGSSSIRSWLVPTALIALGLVPLGAGATRLSQLARGVAADAENARFVGRPLPVVLHVIGATLFCVLGALQFAPTLRRQRWHRIGGRVVLPAGVLAALSGVWMTLFYALPVGENDALLEALRLVLGVGMVVALVSGFLAILRRDFGAHRAWVMRGYAIGMGAGTQALMMVPWALLMGKPTGLTRTLLMGTGWALNLVVAEWQIRRRWSLGASIKPSGGRHALGTTLMPE